MTCLTIFIVFFAPCLALSGFKDWGYQLGVSFDEDCPSVDFKCLKNCYHVSTLFLKAIKCQTPYTNFCVDAIIAGAELHGMNVELYGCLPCKDITKPDDMENYRPEIAAQTLTNITANFGVFQAALIKASGKARLWMDVTANTDHGWFQDKSKNQQCLERVVVAKGLFTSWHDHEDVFGTDYSVKDYDIWYRNPLGIGDDSFNTPPMDDYRMFGGAKTAVVKRYARGVSLCGKSKINMESYIPVAKSPPTKWW
ncbi:unnamed protein product [Bursaphelenchus xylophilus]|uniref:(pine wood nematode) hypothetical protein n=1 Tax=Bursaphelenchus xylophilus TaxID=6326 RepID=A0A7I8WZI4_BURXY|nr:unnamed protein product [Bursaphelenchus xylophilus]CAG9102517.1 unnamed protein product [Bursaphelenchus xylophilus]